MTQDHNPSSEATVTLAAWEAQWPVCLDYFWARARRYLLELDLTVEQPPLAMVGTQVVLMAYLNVNKALRTALTKEDLTLEQIRTLLLELFPKGLEHIWNFQDPDLLAAKTAEIAASVEGPPPPAEETPVYVWVDPPWIASLVAETPKGSFLDLD